MLVIFGGTLLVILGGPDRVSAIIHSEAEQMFDEADYLEKNGWIQESPTLYGWLFSHPSHGVHNFEHAVKIAHATQNQVSSDTT